MMKRSKLEGLDVGQKNNNKIQQNTSLSRLTAQGMSVSFRTEDRW